MSTHTIFIAGMLLALAFPALAQQTPKTVLAADTFDPVRHAVGRLVEGRVELIVSEYVLNKALRAALPDLGAVEKFEKQRLGGQHYLVAFIAPAAGSSVRRVIGIPLQADGSGYVFATAGALICDGSTTCTDCQPVAGCPCTEGGACVSQTVTHWAMGAVAVKVE